MRTDLTILPGLYALIDTDPVRGTTEIRARAFESKPPLSINALSLMGPGWDTPAAVLEAQAKDWAQRLGHEPPAGGVGELCRWLLARLDWACDQHPEIRAFAGRIRAVVNEVRPFGRETGEPVGKCPREFSADRCNTPLYVDPYVDEIQCKRCKQTWKRRDGDWMHLRAQQIAAGVDSA